MAIFVPLRIKVYPDIPAHESLPAREKGMSRLLVIVLPFAGEVPVSIGAVLSIQLTVASVEPVLPTRSEKVKVNDPLPVKRCPVALTQVRVSVHHVKLTYTFPFVQTPVVGVEKANGKKVSV